MEGCAMVEIKLRYVHQDRSRHGKVRFYFRRKLGAPKHRLPGQPGDADFHNCYSELLQGCTQYNTGVISSVAPSTFRWLAVEYFKAPAFKQLNPSTQGQRRRILETMLCEPTKPGSPILYGDVKLRDLSTKALRVLRDRKADLTGAANYRVKVLRQLFKWALEEEHTTTNPARDLSNIKRATQGIHSWGIEEVAQYEACHPIGTKARLALALLLWTGVRRSDVVLLGRQHSHGGWLRFTQSKNRARKPVRVDIPILPELQRVLDVSPTGDLTYLVTEHGRPFAVAGFGNKFRDWCNQAGLPQCSAHGLRKAGAATAAENGATPHQLMSIFGWLSLAEAERYTKAAGRKKMAGEAMGMLVRK